MNTKLLTVKDAKKGMTVYAISAWNHFRGQPRKDQHHRDEKGRSVYTPHMIDIYNVHEWKIQSCGKKILRLCDNEGNRRKMGGYANDNGNYGYFTTSMEDAIAFVNELRESDQYRTNEFKIESNRY
jgi:hypothetical protein